MRILILLAILLLALMAKKTCDGCGQSFTRLKEHEYSCTGLIDFLGGGLKRRVEEERTAEDEREAKRQRVEDEKRAAKEEQKRKAAERQVRGMQLMRSPAN